MTTLNKKTKATFVIILIMLTFPLQKIIAQTNSFYVYFKQNDKRVNIKDFRDGYFHVLSVGFVCLST